jgi:hypothetical protein
VRTLADVFRLIPTLGDGGVGQKHDNPLPANSAERIEECRVWLRSNIERTRTAPKSGRTSYGLKHVAESHIGYISNGQFIAAAVMEGYPFRLIPGSPNVLFGMSKRSIETR